jgi:tetratricopeptide (TPR) repeat protein
MHHAKARRVDPLEYPHSRQLLVDVGGLAGRADLFSEHLETIERYCAGLPLALCTAGARLAVGSEGEIAELARALADPRTRSRELSVEVGFDSVYHGLTSEGARGYRRIGLFPAEEFDAEMMRCALRDLRGAEWRAVLGELKDNNIIESIGDGSYRIRHPLIHAHARSRALAEDSTETVESVQDRILVLLVDFAERCEAALSARYHHDPMRTYEAYTPTARVDEAAVVRQIDRRCSTLYALVRSAYERRRYSQVWRLGQALHTYHLKCHLYYDWVGVNEWAVKAALECPDVLVMPRMRFERGFARLQRWSVELGDPQAVLEEFRDLLRNLGASGTWLTEGQRRTASSVLEALGLAHRKMGACEEALGLYDAAQAALEGIDHPRGLALLDMHRASCCTALGRHEEAAQWLRSADAQFGALSRPDVYNQARARTLLAEDRLAAGLPVESMHALDSAVRLLGDEGAPYQRGDILMRRGTLRREQGDTSGAANDLTTAHALFRRARSVSAARAQQGLDDLGDGRRIASQRARPLP